MSGKLNDAGEREHWKSKLGLILAMAGNAVGLGNFLRFPYIAAKNGGGIFMVPYFISLLLLGVPLMLTEWTLGRLGGAQGRGSAPAVLYAVTRNPVFKYLGTLGVALPFIIVIYYTYIESWCFGLSFMALLGKFPHPPTGSTNPIEFLKPYEDFINVYLGRTGDGIFLHPSPFAYISFVIVMVINLYILYRGVSEGIEKFAKFAMPVLFGMAAILAVRVLTLRNPSDPSLTAIEGLRYLWTPHIEGLANPSVWIAAAGQVFFTLSVGIGSILTYASYLRPEDDITLSSIATASLNELGEVVLGASIAIPAAVVFFGLEGTKEIAAEAFKLGFISMPAIFAQMPLGNLFGFMWFFLLFFAGITSSIALIMPLITFIQDELGWSRQKTVTVIGIIWFILSHIPIFIRGTLDQMDTWAATIGVVFFGLILVLTLTWGIKDARKLYEEMNRGGYITIPMWFVYIMKFITPVILLIICGWFVWSDLSKFPEGKSVILDLSPTALIAKLVMLGILLWILYLTSKMRELEGSFNDQVKEGG